MSRLRNLVNKEELKEKIAQDPTPRTTISFYRYTKITDPQAMRDQLFEIWSKLNVLGRIYLAKEGINAQFSVPTEKIEEFRRELFSIPGFENIPFKIAVEDDGKSFYKLTIKVKDQIVADGLNAENFDLSKRGTHLKAEEFNKMLEEEDSVIVDMRNHYESEVGHFEKAICPDADTFREELPMVKEILKKENAKDKKVMLYCTGGIRCEKASAYLKQEGFENVYQLQGGIIEYAKEVQEKNLECKFKGKNFVFDERFGERISEDIISKCHQCGEKCDEHTNCKNNDCHLLFIQCSSCKEKFAGCCTKNCQEITALPIDEQRKIRKKRGKENKDCLAVYKSRLRPKLYEMV